MDRYPIRPGSGSWKGGGVQLPPGPLGWVIAPKRAARSFTASENEIFSGHRRGSPPHSGWMGSSHHGCRPQIAHDLIPARAAVGPVAFGEFVVEGVLHRVRQKVSNTAAAADPPLAWPSRPWSKGQGCGSTGRQVWAST